MARHPHRFYYPGKFAGRPDETIELPPGESRHALRVLRLTSGDPVTVFDRQGEHWDGEIGGGSTTGAGGVASVRLLERIEPETVAGPEVSIAVSLLKRRAMDWMIEKLSELNVASVHPLVARRTVVNPPKTRGHEPPARWERIALAAAKQSGRNTPMRFQPVVSLGSWLQRERPRVLACFAHTGPGATPLGEWLAGRAGMGLPVIVAVGPEGGWTPGEVEAFRAAGFTAVSLGDLVLRAETAALTVAAACRVML